MSRSQIEHAASLLLLAVLGIVWIVYSREPAPSTRSFLPPAPLVGHPAPVFTAATSDGGSVSLGDLVDREGDAGMPVVLNFWASWCGPCRIETPHFQELSRRYDGQVAILGVNQGEPLPTIIDFGTSFGLTYPLIFDADNEVNQAYDVFNLPTTVFISRQGVVTEVYVGAISQAVLMARIGELVRE